VPAPTSYDYAIVRVVPRVEREEFVNVGAIVFCRVRRYLGARIVLDADRLLALSPELDLETLRRHLDAIPRVCEGAPSAGPIGQLSQAERFHWLTSPRSTVVQTSPVHSGLCSDPAVALEHLVETMVRVKGEGTDPHPQPFSREREKSLP
jgi:hypothetical protein